MRGEDAMLQALLIDFGKNCRKNITQLPGDNLNGYFNFLLK